MKVQSRRSARTLTSKTPRPKAGVASPSLRDRCRIRESFFWLRLGRGSPRRSPTGRPFAAGFGVKVGGVAVAPTRGPPGMKVRPPGPGRRNRWRRLASSTPAAGQRRAGAARPSAAPAPRRWAGSGGERPPRPGGCSVLAKSVQPAAPAGCGARPVQAPLSSGSLAPLAMRFPDSCPPDTCPELRIGWRDPVARVVVAELAGSPGDARRPVETMARSGRREASRDLLLAEHLAREVTAAGLRRLLRCETRDTRVASDFCFERPSLSPRGTGPETGRQLPPGFCSSLGRRRPI